MTIEYVNRRGDRYYVLQGKTKTGKPKFYCSKKRGGAGGEQLSDGYELREDPVRGTVTVRKVRPTRIATIERELVERLAGELSTTRTLVDVDGDSIVVYATNVRKRDVDAWCADLGPFGMGRAEIEAVLVKNSDYSPLFRFTLVDENERVFAAERWCFRGSIDDWIDIAGVGSLEALARALLPHLGEESFYELM
jgi:hypothetical protein